MSFPTRRWVFICLELELSTRKNSSNAVTKKVLIRRYMSVDISLPVTLWVCWTGRSCRSTSGTCMASPQCGSVCAPSGWSSSWTLCHKTRRCRSGPGISALFASGDQIKRLVVLFVPMPINSNILHRSRLYELDIEFALLNLDGAGLDGRQGDPRRQRRHRELLRPRPRPPGAPVAATPPPPVAAPPREHARPRPRPGPVPGHRLPQSWVGEVGFSSINSNWIYS